MTIAYVAALVRFQSQRLWLTVTLRNHHEAPQSFLDSYNRLAYAYNQRNR
jgi:hypothetical protein